MQIALSLVLVIAAGLFAKSLYTLLSVPLGFRADHLTLFSIDPKAANANVETTELLYSRFEQQLSGLPGVTSVSYGTGGPFPQGIDVALLAPGASITSPRQRSGIRSVIGPNYFRTLGIPVLAGREFDQRDRSGASKGVIVNENLARKLFPNKDPIGRAVAMFNGVDPDWMATIVGVVADHHVSWEQEKSFLIYSSAQQLQRISDMTFYVRTSSGVALNEQQIESLIQREVPGLPVYKVQTMLARIKEFALAGHAMALLTVLFAALACIIAVVGIYGVISYTSTLRTMEFGVRIAVGATPSDILGLIIREVGMILAVGLLLAVPFAWFGLFSIRTQLYAISFNQPLIYVGAVLLLLVASAASALIPALRTTRMNVQTALRHE
jgi:predicted permease